MVLYCTIQRCQETKGAKGVSRQKVPKVPGFIRCQGCKGTKVFKGARVKGAKGAWVKSSEGLLRGRVFSRTHLRSSLTPEEGPSCYF